MSDPSPTLSCMSGVYGLMLIVFVLFLLLVGVFVLIWFVFWRIGRRAGEKLHDHLWNDRR